MIDLINLVKDALNSIEKTELALSAVNTFAAMVSSMFITIVSLLIGATATRMNVFNRVAGKVVGISITDNSFQYSGSEKKYLMANIKIHNKTESRIYIDNLTLSIGSKEYQLNSAWNPQEAYRFHKIRIDIDEPVMISIPFNDDLFRNLKDLSFNNEVSTLKVKLKNSQKVVISKKLDKRYEEALKDLIITTKVI